MKKLIFSIIILGLLISCKENARTTIVFSNENIQSIAKFASEEDAFEGKIAYKITPNEEYGPTWRFTEEELNLNKVEEITISFRAKNLSPTDSSIFVFSANKPKGEQLFYHTMTMTNPDVEKNKWRLNMGTFDVSKELPLDAQYSIYIWNNKRQTVFVDDIELTTK